MDFLNYSNSNTLSNTRQAQNTPNALLIGEKFSWKQKKERAELLSMVFEAGYNERYAERAGWCGSQLEFNFLEADDTLSNINQAVHGKKQLSYANFCQLRTCPVCNARRSAKLAVMLSRCIDAIYDDHPNARFIFLTLTIKNCKASELKDTITLIMESYKRLFKRRSVERAIKGAFRTMEITYNQTEDSYHPHLHVLMAVEPDYFQKTSGLYITKDNWIKMWGECLRVDYNPIVDIKKADSTKKAIKEVAKYAVKDSEYLTIAEEDIDKAVEIVNTFTDALFKRRLIQCSGWFKTHWNEAEEEDLMHIQDTGEAHSKYYGQFWYGYKSLKDYYLKYVYEKDENNQPINRVTFDDGYY